jgi:chromosome segregation ATPase
MAEMLGKAAGSGEARVAAGSGPTSGEFTTGSDGPSQAPKKKNPYRKGGPLSGKSGSKKKTGSKSGTPKSGGKSGSSGKPKGAVQIRQKIASLRQQLDGLETKRKTIRQQIVSGAASTNTGTSSGSSSSDSGSSSSQSAQSAQTSQSGTSSSSGSGSSSSSQASTSASALKSQLSAVQSQIAQVKGQIASLRQQLKASKSVGVRNPRESLTGKFRTFQGEVSEARQAMADGRMNDVVDLLGSARALAKTDQQRTVISELQASIGRAGAVTHVVPQITKAGPGR